jgi:hypothetical protein
MIQKNRFFFQIRICFYNYSVQLFINLHAYSAVSRTNNMKDPNNTQTHARDKTRQLV